MRAPSSRRRRAIAALPILLAGVGSPALGQVVSPMSHEVVAVGPSVVARFEVANPYEHAQTSEFFIVDRQGRTVPGGQVSPARRLMAAGARAPLMVRVPLADAPSREVYVCHAITPKHPNRPSAGTNHRGEVCALLEIKRPS